MRSFKNLKNFKYFSPREAFADHIQIRGKYEVVGAQDLSLQRHIWTLHARLVGAWSLQYIGFDVDVVCLLQRWPISHRFMPMVNWQCVTNHAQ
ncbi:hypothetical protein Ancab_026125 [Ancistrocladus abbreviatus]